MFPRSAYVLRTYAHTHTHKRARAPLHRSLPSVMKPIPFPICCPPPVKILGLICNNSPQTFLQPGSGRTEGEPLLSESPQLLHSGVARRGRFTNRKVTVPVERRRRREGVSGRRRPHQVPVQFHMCENGSELACCRPNQGLSTVLIGSWIVFFFF